MKYFGHIKNGFFVECGGNDGFFQDPTYYLEKKLKWTGIIIEPLPISNKCRKYRPKSTVYQYAVTSPDHSNTMLDFIDVNAMSVVRDTPKDELAWVTAGEKTQKITARYIKVPAQTIQYILDKHFSVNPKRNIDLMVLDIEGYEINALHGLDFKKNSPNHLLIECHTDDHRAEIATLLTQHDYIFVAKIGHIDYLFSKRVISK